QYLPVVNALESTLDGSFVRNALAEQRLIVFLEMPSEFFEHLALLVRPERNARELAGDDLSPVRHWTPWPSDVARQTVPAIRHGVAKVFFFRRACADNSGGDGRW